MKCCGCLVLIFGFRLLPSVKLTIPHIHGGILKKHSYSIIVSLNRFRCALFLRSLNASRLQPVLRHSRYARAPPSRTGRTGVITSKDDVTLSFHAVRA